MKISQWRSYTAKSVNGNICWVEKILLLLLFLGLSHNRIFNVNALLDFFPRYFWCFCLVTYSRVRNRTNLTQCRMDGRSNLCTLYVFIEMEPLGCDLVSTTSTEVVWLLNFVSTVGTISVLTLWRWRSGIICAVLRAPFVLYSWAEGVRYDG